LRRLGLPGCDLVGGEHVVWLHKLRVSDARAPRPRVLVRRPVARAAVNCRKARVLLLLLVLAVVDGVRDADRVHVQLASRRRSTELLREQRRRACSLGDERFQNVTVLRVQDPCALVARGGVHETVALRLDEPFLLLRVLVLGRRKDCLFGLKRHLLPKRRGVVQVVGAVGVDNGCNVADVGGARESLLHLLRKTLVEVVQLRLVVPQLLRLLPLLGGKLAVDTLVEAISQSARIPSERLSSFLKNSELSIAHVRVSVVRGSARCVLHLQARKLLQIGKDRLVRVRCF